MVHSSQHSVHRERVSILGLWAVVALVRVAGVASQLIPPAELQKRLDAYNSQRDAIIAADPTASPLGPLDPPLDPLTPQEQAVDALLSAARSAWQPGDAGDFVLGNPTLRSAMETSDLFTLLDGMPKGGLLHSHCESLLPAGWVVSVALRMTGARVDWGNTYDISFNPSTNFPLASDLIAKYGPQVFDDTMTSMVTIPVEARDEPTGTQEEQLAIWAKFQAIFGRLAGIVAEPSLCQQGLEAGFLALAKNNVLYVEVRAGVESPADIAPYDGAIATLQASGYPSFRAKIIIAVMRDCAVDVMMSELEAAAALAAQRPDIIVGFDMVGEEWMPFGVEQSTYFYIDQYLQLPEVIAQFGNGTALPLLLHDGESSNTSDTNFIDAVLLGSTRVGHAYNAFMFPAAVAAARAANFSFEVCPLSNQALRLAPSNLTDHPGRAYLTSDGVEIVIASDDPMLYGYTGMTYDFWAVTVAWELDLVWLKRLAWNSVRFASPAVSATERAAIVGDWQQRWDAWVAALANTPSSAA